MENLQTPPQAPLQTSPQKKSLVIPTLVAILVLCALAYFYFQPKNEVQNSAVNTRATLRSHVVATIPSNLNTKFGEYQQEIFIFNGDGTEVLYPATDIRATSTAFLMKNNSKLSDIYETYNLERSQDGSRVNYATLDITGEKEGLPVVTFDVNGIPQKVTMPFDGTRVSFSADGKHYAYAVYTKEKRIAIIYDGEPLAMADVVRTVRDGKVLESGYTPYGPLLAPQADRLLIVTMDGLKNRVGVADILTKKTFADPSFDSVYSPTFSPDGKHYTYRARNGTKDVIVLDGKVVSTFDISGTAWTPVFSKDSSKIMFTVKRGVGDLNTMGALDVNTQTSIPFVTTDFPHDFQTDTSSSYNEADISAGISRSLRFYDSQEKNWAEIILDTNLSEQNKKLTNYVEVNGIRTTESFEDVDQITFDPTGKFVMFGARQAMQLVWKVYEIVGDKLIER